jgi:hypothetical protein
MENFTLHIFGYGETQLISKENNDKYATDKLTKVNALVDAIWGLKPAEVKGEKKYQVIHFFNHNDIRWLGEESFNLKDEENLIPLIDELIVEITTFEPVVEETTQAVEETTQAVEETTEPVVEETTEPVVEETTQAVEETTQPVQKK